MNSEIFLDNSETMTSSSDSWKPVTHDLTEHSSESSLTDGDKSVLELDSTVEHTLQDKSEERESEADDSVVDEARCNEEINSHLPIVKKKVKTSRCRYRLSYGRKKEICLYKVQHPTASLTHITKFFSKKWSVHVGRPTICNTLVHSQKWLSVPVDCHDMLRIMPPKYVKLDSALYRWYVEAEKKYGLPTNDILIAKAKELGEKLKIKDLSYSNGWLYGFKRRHGILNASAQTSSTRSVAKWQSTFNVGPKMIPAEERCNMNSSNTSLDMANLPKNVSFTDACQGLLKVISYLEGHHHIGGDYVPLLWQIFQQICNHVQDDLFNAKYGHSSLGKDDFQMLSDSSREVANENIDTEEQFRETNVDGISEIKAEQLDPGYEKAMSNTCVNQVTIPSSQEELGDETNSNSSNESNMLTHVSTGRSHSCSKCGQQFGMLTELLKHMTNHAVKTTLAQQSVTKCRETEDLQEPIKCLWNASIQKISDIEQQVSCLNKSGKAGHISNSVMIKDVNTSKTFANNMPNDDLPGSVVSGLTLNSAQKGCISEMDHRANNNTEDKKEPELYQIVHRKIYNCDICGREFDDYRDYRRHLRHHSNSIASDITPNCEEESHLSEVDQEGNTDKEDGSDRGQISEGKKYTCDICGRDFNNYRNYRRHVHLHSGSNPFRCSMCDKDFPNGSALKKHSTVHTGEKPYVCTICGKGLTQSTGLAMHMRLHTGERPYKCTLCDKDFSQSQHLKEHMHLHTGERRYKCTICGKDFAQTPSLKEHMRIHTGEKPYHCTACGKSFLRSGELTKHIRVHTGEKPYKCHICGKCFTQKGNMSKHRLTHEKETVRVKNV